MLLGARTRVVARSRVSHLATLAAFAPPENRWTLVERIFPIVAAYAVAGGATAWTLWTWRWKADSGEHPLARWYHHHFLNQGWPYTSGAAIVPVVAAWGFLVGTALLVDLLLPAGSDYSTLAFAVGASDRCADAVGGRPPAPLDAAALARRRRATAQGGPPL